jgi:UDP-2,3-diacylglucosamine pyrophosphatase LpxH
MMNESAFSKVNPDLYKACLYDIYVKSRYEKIYILFLGDIHYDSPLCDRHRLKEVLKQAQEKNAYIIGMGDYIDMCAQKERKTILNPASKIHNQTKETFSDISQKETDKLIELLEPFRGRILGFIEGNHYFILNNGLTTTEYMSQEFKTNYLGTSCFLHLKILEKSGRWTRVIKIFATHGKGGGGKTEGVTLNNIADQMTYREADIYAAGHDHEAVIKPIMRHTVERRGNTEAFTMPKETVLVRSGGFLHGFVDNERSYTVQNANKPKPIGAAMLKIIYKESKKHAIFRFRGEIL